MAKHFGVEAGIATLTRQAVEGQVDFLSAFAQRVQLLGSLPVDEVASLLSQVPVYPQLRDFINDDRHDCCIATSNLTCWVEKLCQQFHCELYSSQARVENNQVAELQQVLNKEQVVRQFQQAGYQVVFVGDGNNDVPAMEAAEVAIATGITHAPAVAVLAVADYQAGTQEELLGYLQAQLLD